MAKVEDATEEQHHQGYTGNRPQLRPFARAGLRDALGSRIRRAPGSREWTQLWSVSCVALVVLFFGGIFYLRHAGVSGSPQVYLYLEVGGTLISFCYAANALVRFRGTHDRTALILAFGFALSGIIETIGYFALNERLQAGHALPTTVP